MSAICEKAHDIIVLMSTYYQYRRDIAYDTRFLPEIETNVRCRRMLAAPLSIPICLIST